MENPPVIPAMASSETPAPHMPSTTSIIATAPTSTRQGEAENRPFASLSNIQVSSIQPTRSLTPAQTSTFNVPVLQQQEQEAADRNRIRGQPVIDPLTTRTGDTLLEMGYDAQRVKEAILAVRKQKGRDMVSVEEVMSWIQDADDQARAADLPTSTTSSRSSSASATPTVSASGPVTVTVKNVSRAAASSSPTPDIESLQAENQKLREMQECKICMEKPLNVTFLPCGHLVCCEDCGLKLDICPICRMRIEGRIKTYWSGVLTVPLAPTHSMR